MFSYDKLSTSEKQAFQRCFPFKHFVFFFLYFNFALLLLLQLQVFSYSLSTCFGHFLKTDSSSSFALASLPSAVAAAEAASTQFLRTSAPASLTHSLTLSLARKHALSNLFFLLLFPVFAFSLSVLKSLTRSFAVFFFFLAKRAKSRARK